MKRAVEHSERAHALLSASGASRWLSCPPSARLEEKIPEQRSEYAEEGTVAHELSEIYLRKHLLDCDSKERQRLDRELKKIKKNEFYNAEMENAIQEYVEVVRERFMGAKSRSVDAITLLEERLDFSEWVPEGYGTGDVVLIADGVMEIIDLKYGKGVPVSAEANSQMKLYGLGAWAAYNYLYSIHEIRMTIVQPRLDSVSTATLMVDDLLDWAEAKVRPLAKLAFEGGGEFKAGDHCRWCKVKGNCRARADANMEALSYEFQDPALLSNDEIGSILFITEPLKAWAKDVEEYAQGQALKGKPIPQWKLVEGRSNRTITDKAAAIKTLEAKQIDSKKYLKPQELLGIGALEKNIGKKEFTNILGKLVLKPPGKPVLVPETDIRPALNSVDGDFGDEIFD